MSPPPQTTPCFTTRSSRRWGRCSTGRCWQRAQWAQERLSRVLVLAPSMVTSSPGLSSSHQSLLSPFKRAQLGSQSCLASPLDSASKSSEFVSQNMNFIPTHGFQVQAWLVSFQRSPDMLDRIGLCLRRQHPPSSKLLGRWSRRCLGYSRG